VTSLTRRGFLVRAGVLGAALALPAPARALVAGPEPAGQLLAPALRLLAQDTLRGFVVWVVPGGDAYSRAQQLVSPTAGAIEAGADAFLLEGLDRLLPFPDTVLSPVAAALARGTAEELGGGLDVPRELARSLDTALSAALANDDEVPLAAVVAMLFNLLACRVDPVAAAASPFPASPYAGLTHAAKTEVHRVLEEDVAELAAALDTDVPEPQRASLSGLLRLLGATLPGFTAFGAYSEVGVFDSATRTATARPVGWDNTQFSPGRLTPADGWDELIGPYRGMRSYREERR
jgi:hypothetical protein